MWSKFLTPPTVRLPPAGPRICAQLSEQVDLGGVVSRGRINLDNLLEFINTNKKTDLINVYSDFTNSKVKLKMVEQSYIDGCIELAKFKTKYNVTIKDTINFFKDIKTSDNSNVLINNYINEMVVLKIDYMKHIFKTADDIMDIYNFQQIYFITTKALLESLKKNYKYIIKYYETPELALMCINNDIKTLNLLINTPDNIKTSYYKNYNEFKNVYETQLNKNKKQILEPYINYNEIEKIYTDEPDLLLLERYLYELYNFNISSFYSKNQLDIWHIIFESINIFIDEIGKKSVSIIIELNESMKKLNREFNVNEQKDIINNIKAEGIKPILNNKTKKYTWYLVKNDQTNAVDPKNKKYVTFEKLYIEYTKLNVKAYDSIILYIYLFEIICLRYNNIYIAAENLSQLNYETSTSLNEYYKIIIDIINTSNKSIPTSLFWDTTDFNDVNIVNQKRRSNFKSNFIYIGRIKSLIKLQNNVNISCEEIVKIMTPNISKQGFIKICTDVIEKNLLNIAILSKETKA